jgi:hypothetical protein
MVPRTTPLALRGLANAGRRVFGGLALILCLAVIGGQPRSGARTIDALRSDLPTNSAGVIVTPVTPPTPAAPKPTGSPINVGEAVTLTYEANVEIHPSIDAERVSAALASLEIDWKRAYGGWTFRFRPARKGYLAVTLVQERRVDVYVRKDRTSEGLAHDIAHELGHVTDVTYLGERERRRFLEIRGLPTRSPWWTCNSCRDLQVGAGDFAETFAMLVAPRYKFYSELGPRPTAKQLELVQEILPDEVRKRLRAPL